MLVFKSLSISAPDIVLFWKTLFEKRWYNSTDCTIQSNLLITTRHIRNSLTFQDSGTVLNSLIFCFIQLFSLFLTSDTGFSSTVYHLRDNPHARDAAKFRTRMNIWYCRKNSSVLRLYVWVLLQSSSQRFVKLINGHRSLPPAMIKNRYGLLKLSPSPLHVNES